MHFAEQIALDQLAELAGGDRQRQPRAEHDRARRDGHADPLPPQVQLPTPESQHVVAEREPERGGERLPAERVEPLAEVANVPQRG